MKARQRMFDGMPPIWIALAMIPLGALAGLAMLLRSNEEITPRELAAAMLNSSLFSVVVFMICHNRLGDGGMEYLVGLSVLAGFGTNTLLGAAIKSMESVLGRLFGLNDDKKN